MVEYFSPYMSDDIYRKSGFLNDVHVYLNMCVMLVSYLEITGIKNNQLQIK